MRGVAAAPLSRSRSGARLERADLGGQGDLPDDRTDEASARVTVVPECLDMPDAPPEDLRLDTYCTRRPDQPPDLWVTHVPSGSQVRGTGTHLSEATAAALRQIRALLATARLIGQDSSDTKCPVQVEMAEDHAVDLRSAT